jgi:hypothetical protein
MKSTADEQPTSAASTNPNRALTVDSHRGVVLALVLALSVHYALVSSLQTGLFPATLGAVQREFGASHTDMGWLVAVYDLSQIGGAAAASLLSQTWHPSKLIAAGGILSLAGALLFASVDGGDGGTGNARSEDGRRGSGFAFLFPAQVLMGLGAACINVLCPHCVTCAVGGDTARGSFLLSAVYAGSSLGVVAAYVAAGVAGPAAWRALFVANGIAFVVPVGALWYYSRHEPPAALLIEDAEISDVADADGEAFQGDETQSMPPALSGAALDRLLFVALLTAVLRHRTAMLVIAMQTCQSFFLSACVTFLPKYLEDAMEQSATVASFLVALTIPACTAGMLASGWVIQRLSLDAVGVLRLLVLCASVQLPLNGIFFVPAAHIALFAVLLVANMALSFAAAVPSVMIFPMIFDKPHVVPYANGLSNVVVKLAGSMTGPVVLGALLDQRASISPGGAFLAVGVLAGGAALLCAVMALRAGLAPRRSKHPFFQQTVKAQ